jgi:hypothetical protein
VVILDAPQHGGVVASSLPVPFCLEIGRYCDVIELDGEGEGCASVLTSCKQIGSLLGELPDGREVTFFTCLHESCGSMIINSVHIRTTLAQDLRYV